MSTPRVLYLEHDGKVLLVDSEGNGPQTPVMNNTGSTKFRFQQMAKCRNWELSGK